MLPLKDSGTGQLMCARIQPEIGAGRRRRVLVVDVLLGSAASPTARHSMCCLAGCQWIGTS